MNLYLFEVPVEEDNEEYARSLLEDVLSGRRANAHRIGHPRLHMTVKYGSLEGWGE